MVASQFIALPWRNSAAASSVFPSCSIGSGGYAYAMSHEVSGWKRISRLMGRFPETSPAGAWSSTAPARNGHRDFAYEVALLFEVNPGITLSAALRCTRCPRGGWSPSAAIESTTRGKACTGYRAHRPRDLMMATIAATRADPKSHCREKRWPAHLPRWSMHSAVSYDQGSGASVTT